jgi:hypothetical protein
VRDFVAGGGHDRACFARCVCFFVDNDNQRHVAVRWLADVDGAVVDPVSGLVPLALSRREGAASYSAMPAAAILNGALVISAQRTSLWALQSPVSNVHT